MTTEFNRDVLDFEAAAIVAIKIGLFPENPELLDLNAADVICGWLFTRPEMAINDRHMLGVIHDKIKENLKLITFGEYLSNL